MAFKGRPDFGRDQLHHIFQWVTPSNLISKITLQNIYCLYSLTVK